MAIAGKVAITPGGEWSVDIAYDKLVVVTFGNNVYLSIKPSTGIEPTNEEYWMLLIENVTQEQYDNIINGTTTVGNAAKLGGKGASEYVLKDDSRELVTLFSSITTPTDIRAIMYNLPSGHYTCATTSYPNVTFPFADGVGTQIEWERLKHANGYYYGTLTITSMIDNSQWATCSVYNNFQYTEWQSFLPKSGGKLQGVGNVLDIESTSQDAWIYFTTIAGRKGSAGYYNGIASVASDIRGGRIGVIDDGTPQYWTDAQGTKKYNLLHTGNKPTGTYTGNGSATARTINIGGIGSVLKISGNTGTCLVFPMGGAFGVRGGDVKSYSATIADFSGGVLTLATTDDMLNANGVTYTYQVL